MTLHIHSTDSTASQKGHAHDAGCCGQVVSPRHHDCTCPPPPPVHVLQQSIQCLYMDLRAIGVNRQHAAGNRPQHRHQATSNTANPALYSATQIISVQQNTTREKDARWGHKSAGMALGSAWDLPKNAPKWYRDQFVVMMLLCGTAEGVVLPQALNWATGRCLSRASCTKGMRIAPRTCCFQAGLHRQFVSTHSHLRDGFPKGQPAR